jgi:hypothetical protein
MFAAKSVVKAERKPQVKESKSTAAPSIKSREVVDLREPTNAREMLMAWTVGKPEEVVHAFAVSFALFASSLSSSSSLTSSMQLI